MPGNRRAREDDLHDVYCEQVSTVYAYFCYSTDAHTAEDLTAATFERVVRAWSGFDATRSSARTWVLSIARNILIDHYRRQRFRRGTSLDEHPAVADHLVLEDDPASRLERIETIKGWLSELTPREREVVALRYGADFSTSELAHALRISEANVYQILSRALRRLRYTLVEPGLNGSGARDAAPAASDISAAACRRVL